MLGTAFLGTLFNTTSPTAFVDLPFSDPSALAPLGTDYLGRSVLSRFLDGGARFATLSLLATAMGIALGTIVGLVAGYSRGWRSQLAVQALDVVLAFPQIVLILLFLSLLGPRAWLIVALVGVGLTPRIARVVRAAASSVAELEYVESARALGIGRWRILLGEVLPNVMSPLMVEAGLRLTYAFALVGALGFLGFGATPPTPDWGVMINENRLGLAVQPWAVLTPIIAIACMTIGSNLVADGIALAAGRYTEGEAS